MSRNRFCLTNDRDGFIEELARDLWEDRQPPGEARWQDARPEVQVHFRKLAAETLRILEHGHG